MALNRNLHPSKPTKEDKERHRKEKNKCKAARKIGYRFNQPEKKETRPVAITYNVFWFKENNGIFSVFKGKSTDLPMNPIRKYKVKDLAIGFCRKANANY